MELLWPGSLYLLGLIPLFVLVYIWILRRRKPYAVRYSSLSSMRFRNNRSGAGTCRLRFSCLRCPA
jgi:hypothetical protein